MADKPLGIYIHIPFCESKCTYCDFYSLPSQTALIPKYQSALMSHIKESSPRLSGYSVDSVYFGGGTPSFYGASNLIKLFTCLKRNFKIRTSSEVTFEANPDSVSYHDLKKLRKAGFNRISIGVQSANDSILKTIGRRHTFEQAETAVAQAKRAGFDNISIDLIYGLPEQSRSDWADTLARAAALKPQHFSCYGLKIEPGTPLYSMRDSFFIPNDDAQADMYLYAVEALDRFGYKQYEISNFALKGMESRHNLKYWQLGEYAAFGPSAHSFVGGVRYAYVRDLKEYIKGIEEKGEVVSEKEEISKYEQAVEYLMLGLRTTNGICESEYYSIYQSTFAPIERLLREFAQNRWARYSNGRWSLTPQGFLISNRLIAQIIDVQADLKRSIGTPWKSRHTPLQEQDEYIQLHF